MTGIFYEDLIYDTHRRRHLLYISYIRDECEPRADGAEPTLFRTYRIKREKCEAGSNTTSKLSKVNLFSMSGDLSAAPDYLPGSPNHPTDNARLEFIKVAGSIVGHTHAVSTYPMHLFKARLHPIYSVLNIQDTEKITNVLQLQSVSGINSQTVALINKRK